MGLTINEELLIDDLDKALTAMKSAFLDMSGMHINQELELAIENTEVLQILNQLAKVLEDLKWMVGKGMENRR